MDSEITIIGCGIVGLAIANSLSKRFNHVFIIEKDHSYGMSTSSRNSEVIHSGIYYPKNSLKSHLCVKGAKLMYDFCEKHGVKYSKCGKIIISNSSEEKKYINRLKQFADDKNISSRLIEKDEIINFEPNIIAENGLHIPSAGVVDSHGVMTTINRLNIESNVEIVYKTKLIGLKKIKSGYEVTILNPDSSITQFTSKVVVNSSGLWANETSKMLGIDDRNYELSFWKGEYFWINKKRGFINSLIYPVPNKNLSGLGIHTTIDVTGRLKVGPDATFIGGSVEEDYHVDMHKKKIFFDFVKSYIKDIDLDSLEPDYAGIRPKLQKPNESFRDFVISNEERRGFPNFINLIGIESPGLTSAFAIAEYVNTLIKI